MGNPTITRDEFIDNYMKRSDLFHDLSSATRTKDGFTLGDHVRIAIPCDCGDEVCEGWQMSRPDGDDITGRR